MNKDICISIITLTKNDNLGLLRTLLSIENQNLNKKIELLILDGSEKKIFDKNKRFLAKERKKNLNSSPFLRRFFPFAVKLQAIEWRTQSLLIPNKKDRMLLIS